MKKRNTARFLSTCAVMFMGAVVIIYPSIAADPEPEPEITEVFIETAENGAIDGDSILVVYNQPMLINAQPAPLAGGMEDINNVPGSEIEAPAEYPQHRGNATARKCAKNYRIKITPGPYSNTLPYDGDWSSLGGSAYYHPSDTSKRMVILRPPNKQSKFFAPGDRVEITVADTVKSPRKKRMRANRNKGKEIAS